jgi:hypothetical protein
MTKDEALKLALEFVEANHLGGQDAFELITGIKQARALDKKAENARELGLDYEPAGGTQVSKVWWDGEKLTAKPIPLEDIYLPAPVQEPVAWMFQHGETGRMSFVSNDGMNNPELFLAMNPRYALVCALVTPPSAQRTWVGLTNDEVNNFAAGCHLGSSVQGAIYKAEAKLKEKNNG